MMDELMRKEMWGRDIIEISYLKAVTNSWKYGRRGNKDQKC